MNRRQLAQKVASAAEEKKAQDIKVLDIRGLSVFADYFVICHGNSAKQVQAITAEVRKQLEEMNVPIQGIEGTREARWVLIDLSDVVMHVFHKDEREFYNLERLWGDAELIHVGT